jgi:hypothetical protein
MRFGCLVIALAFLAAFASDSWGQSKRTQPQAPTQQQQAAPDQRGTEKSPVVVKVLPAQENEDKAKENAREHDEKRKFDTDTLWLSQVTVALIFLQALIFAAQAYFLWGTLKATANAASAAQSAAKIADRAIELSESASLTVDTWNVENWGALQPKIKFHVYNSGRNTAEIMEMIFRTRVNVALPEFPDYTDVPKSSLAIVAPGARPESTVIPTISPEQKDAIESGAMGFFVYGRITFKTVNFPSVWELGFAQRITFPPDAQGNRMAYFEYPPNPGFNFLRPKAQE